MYFEISLFDSKYVILKFVFVCMIEINEKMRDLY